MYDSSQFLGHILSDDPSEIIYNADLVSLWINSHYYLTVNYNFCLNKLLIFCLLIVSKVFFKFRNKCLRVLNMVV